MAKKFMVDYVSTMVVEAESEDEAKKLALDTIKARGEDFTEVVRVEEPFE